MRKRTAYRLSAAVFLAGFMMCAAASAETAARVPDMIENRTFGFRVSNPDLWTALRNQSGSVMVLGHPEKPRVDFVTVNVEDLSKQPGVTLEAYKKQLVENIKKSIEGFEIRSDEPYTIDNTDAHQMIYAGRVSGKSVRWKTLFTLKKSRAYVLTYAADDADYFKHLESADKIIYSFRFLT